MSRPGRQGLPIPGHRLEEHALLSDVLLLRAEHADDCRDVVQLGGPLPEHARVDLFEVVVRLAGLGCGCGQQQDETPYLRFSTTGSLGADPAELTEAVGDEDAVASTTVGLKNLKRVRRW